MSENKIPVSVNNAECSGCMGCADMFPELFEWDEVNEVVILKSDEADPDLIHEAMSLCPKDCIEAHE